MNAEYFNRITDTYGLGVDEFLDRFKSQGHSCKLCRCQLVLFSSDASENPVVDHDHETGKVRGILCRTCNVAVGYLEKDTKRTLRVLRYLFQHEKKGSAKVLGFFRRFMSQKTLDDGSGSVTVHSKL